MVVSQARCANSTFPIVWRALIETNVVFDKEKCKPFVLNIWVEFLHSHVNTNIRTAVNKNSSKYEHNRFEMVVSPTGCANSTFQNVRNAHALNLMYILLDSV